MFKKIILIFTTAVFVSALGCGLWFLRNGEFMKIKEVKVSGTRMILPESIISLTEEKSARHGGFFGMILPGNHQLSYKNDKDLTELIKTRFPRVNDVSITRDYESQTLSIAISERKEEIIWCLASASDEREGYIPSCFWLDDEGFVIGEAPDSEGTLVFVVSDKTGKEVFLGKTIIAEDKLKNLTEAAKMIKDFGWAAKEITIDDTSMKEASFNLFSGQKIFVSLEQNSAVFGRPVINTITASGKWPEVEYVDLRIEGKGFYKLK